MSVNIPTLKEVSESVTGVRDMMHTACRVAGCGAWGSEAAAVKRGVRSGSKEELAIARDAILMFYAMSVSAVIRDATVTEKTEFLRTVLFAQHMASDRTSRKAVERLLGDVTDGHREIRTDLMFTDAVMELGRACYNEYYGSSLRWNTKGANILLKIRGLCDEYVKLSPAERAKQVDE